MRATERGCLTFRGTNSERVITRLPIQPLIFPAKLKIPAN